jgi:exopolysaccharide biosynthesis protein
MNLDGGSSTQMVVGDQVVNAPTVQNGAVVSSGLVVRRKQLPGDPVHAAIIQGR